MTKKYQFFIGSTYEDLKEERRMVIEAIMRRNHIPAGMEYFPATGEPQLEYIEPLICESDYYLLILAGKYGKTPEGHDKSYVEMEYDIALKNEKRVIAFVHRNPDSLPEQLREKTEKGRKKFNKFREKVLKANKMVYMWDDASSLRDGVYASIGYAVESNPVKTCWLHVHEDDIYTPLDKYMRMEDTLEFSHDKTKRTGIYQNKLSPSAIQSEIIEDKNLRLTLNLPIRRGHASEDVFAGYFYRMISRTKNWVKYVSKGYCLSFDCVLNGIDELDIVTEIKNASSELCKSRTHLEGVGIKQTISIDLKEHVDDIEEWRDIKEICLVFRPADTKLSGSVDISAFVLKKKE